MTLHPDADLDPPPDALYDALNGREIRTPVPPEHDLIEPPPDEYDALDAAQREELEIQKEVCRLRVRTEAQRRWALEQHPPTEYSGLYLDASELDSLPEVVPLIDGVLNRSTYSVLRGRDHTFKSFVALDWSWCLATGKKWQNRETEQARTLYIVGEGAYGIRARKTAWEAAWRHTIPSDRWTLRIQALDLHAGGPALDELLHRVEDGGYGLVVIDTLRRVSGRADGNSSEMGAVVDNLTRIREATDRGSVLVIAHTDKGDNDSRGFSGIEDDADTVWHARRPTDGPPMALDLDCKKMKDGPDGEHIELTMSQVLDSLVVSKYSRSGQGFLDDDAGRKSDAAVMAAMRETFAHTGATTKDLQDVLPDLPRATLYRARGRLLDSGQIIAGRGSRLQLAKPVSPVSRGSETGPPQSHPSLTARLTGVSPDSEHESHPVSPESHPNLTQSHTPPLPLKAGEVRHETETDGLKGDSQDTTNDDSEDPS